MRKLRLREVTEFAQSHLVGGRAIQTQVGLAGVCLGSACVRLANGGRK